MMKRWQSRLTSQEGASAVWFSLMTAFVFVALAAVTVDAGEFFEDAAAEQRSADFACLAGAQSIADYSVPAAAARVTNGYQAAARNITSNIAEYSGLSSAEALAAAAAMQADPTHVWADPSGRFGVRMEWDGTADTFTVEIGQTVPTTFGNTLGITAVEVDERAVCAVGESGIAGLPFAVTPFTSGFLNTSNPCDDAGPGQCGQIAIPRDDVSGTKNELVYNSVFGVQPELQVYAGGSPARCDGANPSCDHVNSDSGLSTGHLTDAFLTEIGGGYAAGTPGRLRDIAPGERSIELPKDGILINNDRFDDVVNDTGATATPVLLPTPVPVADRITRCDHPRVGRVPIMESLGSGWRPIRGFILVFIRDPDESGTTDPREPPAPGTMDSTIDEDVKSSNALKQISAQPFMLAPGATCTDADGIDRPLDASGRFGTFELVE